jgi:hypothetical protein
MGFQLGQPFIHQENVQAPHWRTSNSQTYPGYLKNMEHPRQKFFTWILLHGRLNTKYMMIKKNLFVEFSHCIICDDCPQEIFMHLFFECSFSQSFWWAIGLEWSTDLDVNNMILEAK